MSCARAPKVSRPCHHPAAFPGTCRSRSPLLGTARRASELQIAIDDLAPGNRSGPRVQRVHCDVDWLPGHWRIERCDASDDHCRRTRNHRIPTTAPLVPRNELAQSDVRNRCDQAQQFIARRSAKEAKAPAAAKSALPLQPHFSPLRRASPATRSALCVHGLCRARGRQTRR